MAKEKTNYEEALDSIRVGATLKTFQENYQRYLDADISKEYLEELRNVLKDYEDGKIKVICTEADKKRIIKEEILDSIKGGMTHKEAENWIRERLKDETLKFIK